MNLHGKQRLVPCLFCFFLLLAGVSAQAATYTFSDASDTLPTGCQKESSGNYSCGALSLVAGESIAIAQSTTITFNGAFDTGAGVMINSNGTKNLTTGGIPTLTMVVNGAATLGTGSILNGDLTTIGAGAVSVAVGSWINGNVVTDIGFVAMGAATLDNKTGISGSISTGTGLVGLGAGAYVGGSVKTVIGYVGLGAGATINGAVTTTTAGYVGLGAGAIINGDISTGTAGAVILGANSSVIGSITVHGTTGADYITTADSSKVSCNISTAGSYVTLGANTQVGGSVSAKDYVTVGAGVYIAGNVTSTENYVVVGDGSTVLGQVSFVTYQTIDAGSHVYNGVIDTSACGATPPSGIPVSGSTATGLFDCLEIGSSAVSLYTKLAGTDFSFDIAALKTDKTLNSSYVTSGSKYARVELFDDTSPANCPTYTNEPVAKQTVTFTAGRTSTGVFNLPYVYKKLRCRVTECTDSNCTAFSQTMAPSCSSDQFSVRPVAVILASSDANANAFAPLATATQVIKAGASFNLSAVTVSTDNYLELLTLDTSKLTAQNPINDTTLQTGGVVGTLTPPTLKANTESTATYSEVGYLYLEPGAYRDDSFTAVDSVKSDCITSTLNDKYLSAGLIGSQYGCSIANTAALTLGRFIPDHFGVVGSVVNRSKLQLTGLQKSLFTYMDEPMLLALTVTAYNKSEGATFNYQGKFAKLNTTGWGLSNWTCSGISDFQCMGLSANNDSTLLTNRLAIIPTSSASNTSWSNGSSDFTANIILQRGGSPVAPDGPYDALKLGAKPQDLDGVTLPPKAVTDTGHCVNLNTKTSIEDTDCTFEMTDDETDLRRKVAETKVRFGRLSLANAYGSELQDLIIPVEAQYWNGSSFVRNDDDNNTPLADSNIVVVGNYQGGLTTAVTKFGTFDVNGNCSIITDTTKNGVVSGGKSCILLSKPTAPVTGSVDLLINLGSLGSPGNCLSPALFSGSSAGMAYLSGNWCGANYDRDPTAHINLGLYKDNGKGSHRLIYLREVY